MKINYRKVTGATRAAWLDFKATKPEHLSASSFVAGFNAAIALRMLRQDELEKAIGHYRKWLREQILLKREASNVAKGNGSDKAAAARGTSCCLDGNNQRLSGSV